MISITRSLTLLVLPAFKHSIALHLLEAIYTNLWFSKVTLTLLHVALLICYFPKSGGGKHWFESKQMKSNIFDFLDINTNCGKRKNLRIVSTFTLTNCIATVEDVGRSHGTPRSNIKAFIPYTKGINSFLPSWLHCPMRVYAIFLFDMWVRRWGGVDMKCSSWTWHAAYMNS